MDLAALFPRATFRQWQLYHIAYLHPKSTFDEGECVYIYIYICTGQGSHLHITSHKLVSQEAS